MKDATQRDNIEMANVEETDLATNQEGIVLPWFCGDRKVTVRWISPVVGVWTTEVDMGGKK